MTELPGNPHAYNVEYAMNCTVLSSDDSGTQTIESLLMDNARANLAVAHEMRTQTLAIIAASTAPDGTYALAPDLVDWAQTQLADRVGFDSRPPAKHYE